MEHIKKQLHAIIEKEVFIRAKNQNIIGSDGNNSPWMFDFKKTLLNADFLDWYATLFLGRFKDRYPFQVGGLESGSIPLITAIITKSASMDMTVSGFYIRKSRKKSGTMSLIEGSLNNSPIILVDDLMHSGKSFIQQIEALEKYNEENHVNVGVHTVSSILCFKDKDQYPYFREKGIHIHSFFELNDFKDTLGVTNLRDETLPVEVNPYTLIWRLKGDSPVLTPVVPKSELVQSDGCLFVCSDDGHVMCLDTTTGKELWNYYVPMGDKEHLAFSSPTLCNGTIVVGSRDGNIYALDAKTGKRMWVYLDADWIQGSPGSSETLGYIFAPLSFGLFKKQGKVVALDGITGKKVWEYSIEAPIVGGITCVDDVLFFGSEDMQMHALDAKTGKVLWTRGLKIKPRGFPSVSKDNKKIFIGGISKEDAPYDQGSLYCLDAKTGKELFIFRGFRFGSYSTPCIHEDLVSITSLDSFMYCINSNDGTVVWKANLDARSFASPILVPRNSKDTTVCVGANNGRLYEFNLKTGSLLSCTYFTERILNAVLYDATQNIFFVPTQANDVFAIKDTQ